MTATPSPADGLRECLALLITDLDDSPKPRMAGCLEIRCANFLRTHGPALLAALRLREACEGLEEQWRDVANDDDAKARERNNNQWYRGSANANRICADDLARVLEEGE